MHLEEVVEKSTNIMAKVVLFRRLLYQELMIVIIFITKTIIDIKLTAEVAQTSINLLLLAYFSIAFTNEPEICHKNLVTKYCMSSVS